SRAVESPAHRRRRTPAADLPLLDKGQKVLAGIEPSAPADLPPAAGSGARTYVPGAFSPGGFRRPPSAFGAATCSASAPRANSASAAIRTPCVAAGWPATRRDRAWGSDSVITVTAEDLRGA